MPCPYQTSGFNVPNYVRHSLKSRARNEPGATLNLCDKGHSGRPRTATDDRVNELITVNRRITQEHLSIHRDISGSVCSVRSWLDENVRNQWVGRRGAREWSPRSPDLNPLDFVLWDYLKEKVYEVKIRDLQHLRTRIVEKCRETTAYMLHRILSSMTFHLQTCYELVGAHIEHIL
ncbi:hypothetical protein ANN_20708 [Periplaneta americana]|uniref:Uncharacterized protein n=1 Tax=Periplaneta americana TaxID=6978 RepID=A0ABQ8SE13_PERAM|nr:hypothetical protein ANN_20708 [Periplaneta americana]